MLCFRNMLERCLCSLERFRLVVEGRAFNGTLPSFGLLWEGTYSFGIWWGVPNAQALRYPQCRVMWARVPRMYLSYPAPNYLPTPISSNLFTYLSATLLSSWPESHYILCRTCERARHSHTKLIISTYLSNHPHLPCMARFFCLVICVGLPFLLPCDSLHSPACLVPSG